jgi:methionine-rich copper-binding protein CopC
MPVKRLLAAWLAVMAAPVALAHAHLKQATPADGSVLSAAPAQFTLTFDEAAQLTALTLQKSGGPAQKIAPLPSMPAATFRLAAPNMTPGDYELKYRVLSDDSHVVSGSIKFTLK